MGKLLLKAWVRKKSCITKMGIRKAGKPDNTDRRITVHLPAETLGKLLGRDEMMLTGVHARPAADYRVGALSERITLSVMSILLEAYTASWKIMSNFSASAI